MSNASAFMRSLPKFDLSSSKSQTRSLCSMAREFARHRQTAPVICQHAYALVDVAAGICLVQPRQDIFRYCCLDGHPSLHAATRYFYSEDRIRHLNSESMARVATFLAFNDCLLDVASYPVDSDHLFLISSYFDTLPALVKRLLDRKASLQRPPAP